MDRKISAINDGLTKKYNIRCRLWESLSNHTSFFFVTASLDVDQWEIIEVDGPVNTQSATFLWEEQVAGIILKKAALGIVGVGANNRDIIAAWENTDRLIDVPPDYETCIVYSTIIETKKSEKPQLGQVAEFGGILTENNPRGGL